MPNTLQIPTFVNAPQNVVAALLAEGSSSKLFQALMLAFANTPGATIRMADHDHPGTHYDARSGAIYIDPDMLPGSGSVHALANYAEVAVALAHELGHALAPNGALSPGSADSLMGGISIGETDEAVASAFRTLSLDYPLSPRLDCAAKSARCRLCLVPYEGLVPYKD
ncbi:MAG: hypothetical protein ACREU6_13135, partial [Steroidobacteraceae bacterium]